MKFCPKCKETKPRAEWPKNAARYDGLRSYCGPCCVEYGAARYVAHRGEFIAREMTRYHEGGKKEKLQEVARATRAVAIADRGGRCIHCLKTEDDYQKTNPNFHIKLEFHHTGVKHFNLARKFQWGWEFVKDEVALTVLFCKGCHIQETKRIAAKRRDTKAANLKLIKEKANGTGPEHELVV